MIIVEIILTVIAWRRGWNALALIPMGAALVLGLLVGALVSGSGGDLDSVLGATILIDIMAIGALIGMVAKPQEKGTK